MIISIKNFQSIEDLTLTVVEGAFTCIVGQSNIGKSAIRRALECVLYNHSDASYIRTGTKLCSVEITFDNGTHIKWQRDEKSSSYEINGESFSKLSKTVPQPIIDLGFRELDLNKDKLNVQIASQFDNIFLLNMTGGKVTDVFSNLGNLNKIINANKSCASDIKSNKGRLNLRKEDLVSVKSKIKKYSGLDLQRDSFRKIKESFEEIKGFKKKKEDLTNLAKRFDKTAYLLKALSPSKLVNIEEPNVDVSTFLLLQKLFIKLNSLTAKVEASSGLKEVSEVTLDLDLAPMLALSSLSLKYEKALNINRCYSDLTHLSEVNLNLSEFQKIKPLKDLLLKFEKSKASLVDLRERIKKTENDFENLLDQEKEIHKEVKVCPLCDKEF